MNVEKRSKMNVDKRSNMNVKNLGCVAGAAFGTREWLETCFFLHTFLVVGAAFVDAGHRFVLAGTAVGLRRRLLFVTGAAYLSLFPHQCSGRH